MSDSALKLNENLCFFTLITAVLLNHFSTFLSFSENHHKQGRKIRLWGGGGGGRDIQIGAPSASKVAQVKICRGTFPTHETFLTSKKKRGKKKEKKRENMYNTQKGTLIISIFILPQKRGGGGGHLILCPPPEKTWGDTSPRAPPPPGFAPMITSGCSSSMLS